jgi:hypothetical protein
MSNSSTFTILNKDTTGKAAKATNMVGGNSTTLLGSIGYQSAVDTTTLLSPNTTTTKKFLTQTGDATNGAIPSWQAIVAADLANINTAVADTVLTSTTAHIAVDFAFDMFSHTTTEDTTLDNPTNMPSSGYTKSGMFKITQGVTPRAMAFASYYVFPDGFYSLTQTGGAFNMITYVVISPTVIYCWMS